MLDQIYLTKMLREQIFSQSAETSSNIHGSHAGWKLIHVLKEEFFVDLDIFCVKICGNLVRDALIADYGNNIVLIILLKWYIPIQLLKYMPPLPKWFLPIQSLFGITEFILTILITFYQIWNSILPELFESNLELSLFLKLPDHYICVF